MDRDKAIRRAEVVMAWARGEVVQWRMIGGEVWNNCRSVQTGYQPANFFAPDCEWRVKPEPLECWVWVSNGERFGEAIPTDDMRYVSKETPNGRWVRMREVE